MQRTLIRIRNRQALGFCLAISAFELLTYMASDMIMPAMLAVTAEFGADPRHVPNAFNLYLLGGVCLQWLIGPLSDQWGRRRLLLIGCALFSVSCALAVSTQTIELFNLLRLLQGMGLGFVVAVSYPALQEVFCEADAVRLMAILGNVALLSPLLGPLLGSVLLEWLSWRELFVAVAIAAALVWLGLWACMPETVGVERRDGQRLMPVAFSWQQMRQRYFALLSNRRFLSASLALGLMSLPLIAWIGLAPLLLMQVHNLTPIEYGLWQIPVFSAVIIGNLLLDRLLASHQLSAVIRLSQWPFCLGLLALLACAVFDAGIGPVVVSLALYAIGLGMGNAALYRLALFASDDSKGLVSAMIGMLSITVMGLGGTVMAINGAGTRLDLFALWAAFGGLMCLPFSYPLFARQSPRLFNLNKGLLMTHLPYSDALCALPNPYCRNSTPTGLFDLAMAETSRFHCRHTPGYERWLNNNGLHVDDLDSLNDWSTLPPVFASFFKRKLLLSSTGNDALELTSSGTSGEKSRMRYDDRSMAAAQYMVERIFDHYGWHTPETPCNYLLLSYEPQDRITLGTAYTDQFLCRFAPVNRLVYALRNTGAGHQFDVFGVIPALQSFAEEGLPVRIFGFPAFLWQTLQRMQATGVADVKLPDHSLAFFGGGWKTQAAQEIPKSQLYAQIHRQLGIAPSNCRDGFGAVEHAVPYIECAEHHFHVPVYSQIYVRDPGDFSVLPYGQQGLLGFASPYISSSPAHAVVMSDLATLHPGSSCGCGLDSDWFQLHGRAGTSAGRSCAMAAADLLGSH